MDRTALRSMLLLGFLGALLPAHAGIRQGADLSRKISFSHPAARASVLLKDLSKETGVPLSASVRMADEVLIVKVKDVPIKDLLAKMAEAADAEWRPLEGGYELGRPSTLQNAAEREERQERAAAIQARLSEAVGKIAGLPAFTQAEANKMAEEQEKAINDWRKSIESGGRAVNNLTRDDTPSSRAVVALLDSIGASALATLPKGRRVVFSTSPNRVQYALSNKARQVVSDFVASQRMLSTANQQLKKDDTRQFFVAGTNGGDLGPGDPSLGIGKAILSVTHANNVLRAELIVADTNGQTLASGMYTLATVVSPGDTAKSADPAKEKIELSDLAKEYVKLTRRDTPTGGVRTVQGSMMVVVNGSSITLGSNPGEKTVALSDALRARLIRPEEFDPQGLVPEEALTSVSNARGENLVACLPDSAIMPITWAFATDVDMNTLMTRVLPNNGVQVKEENGWLTATPRFPTSSREQRIDRVAYGKLLRTMNGQRLVRLGQLADFVKAQSKTVDLGDYDGVTMRLINAPAASDAMTMLSQPDMLRFYASLTRQQRDVLEAGGVVTVANLGAPQTQPLFDEVFQSPAGPQPKGEAGAQYVRYTGTRELGQERTEMLPGGLPPNGSVQVRLERSPAAIGKDVNGGTVLMTPDQIASRMFQSERADLAPFGQAPKINTYEPVLQTKLTFQFDFGTAQMQRLLTDTWIENTNGAVTYDRLPADLRAKVDASFQTMKSSLGGVRIAAPAVRTNQIPPKP